MKLFKILFTTSEEFTLFGQVPGIIDASQKAGLSIKFNCGGWEGNDADHYFHEWISDENSGRITDFFKSTYGEFLINFCIQDIDNGALSGSGTAPSPI